LCHLSRICIRSRLHFPSLFASPPACFRTSPPPPALLPTAETYACQAKGPRRRSPKRSEGESEAERRRGTGWGCRAPATFRLAPGNVEGSQDGTSLRAFDTDTWGQASIGLRGSRLAASGRLQRRRAARPRWARIAPGAWLARPAFRLRSHDRSITAEMSNQPPSAVRRTKARKRSGQPMSLSWHDPSHSNAGRLIEGGPHSGEHVVGQLVPIADALQGTLWCAGRPMQAQPTTGAFPRANPNDGMRAMAVSR
jgi:hypothetical protein